MINPSPTPYPELNALLAEHVDRVEAALGDNLVGVYVIGSFALGAGDMSSDCDFLVVTADQVTPEQEAALRAWHDEIPTRSGYWEINFEGSYAPRSDLEILDRLGEDWLYNNRGHRTMMWSPHCNCEDSRWVLRERGITLVGPEPQSFVAEVPADMLRDKMRALIDGFVPDLRSWASFDYLWTQRYAVETTCRMLYTLETGEVESKRASLEWGLGALPSEWHGLISQALSDRHLPWNDPVRPETMEPTLAFTEYARERSRIGTESP